jgi:hypothetical protein
VILVGDACTDDPEAAVLSIGDPRLRLEDLERNSGSAWRPNSYRSRRGDEQREYVRRIARRRTFVERELLAYTWLRLRRKPKMLPDLGPRPEVMPPGWQVTQWRRIRGLPEEPEG